MAYYCLATIYAFYFTNNDKRTIRFSKFEDPKNIFEEHLNAFLLEYPELDNLIWKEKKDW